MENGDEKTILCVHKNSALKVQRPLRFVEYTFQNMLLQQNCIVTVTKFKRKTKVYSYFLLVTFSQSEGYSTKFKTIQNLNFKIVKKKLTFLCKRKWLKYLVFSFVFLDNVTINISFPLNEVEFKIKK